MTRIAIAAGIPLIAMMLTGCGGPPSGGNGVAPDAPAAIATPESTPLPAPTPAATPITLKQETDAIDFNYVIPAEAAAIPALRAELLADAASAKQAALHDRANYIKELPPGAPANPYGLEAKWTVAGETPQLLVLLDTGYVYTGGAHGSDVFRSLIWDNAGNRALPFDALFTDKAKALATIRQPFCDTLAAQQRKRRGGDFGGDAYPCPPFDQYITLAFGHPVGGKFGRIGAYIPADVAGSHAEGNYTFDLFIPRAMIGFIDPKWRASFPGG